MSHDHANARLLAAAVAESEGLSLPYGEVGSNIVIFRVEPKLGSAAELVAELKAKGVWSLAIGPQQVRLVTHLDVTEAQCRQAVTMLRETAGRMASGKKTAKELEPAY
jgi:threonine aldolase